MSAEDNSSAESADIGEALVAALGFEPTDGRKAGRKAAATDPAATDPAATDPAATDPAATETTIEIDAETMLAAASGKVETPAAADTETLDDTLSVVSPENEAGAIAEAPTHPGGDSKNRAGKNGSGNGRSSNANRSKKQRNRNRNRNKNSGSGGGQNKRSNQSSAKPDGAGATAEKKDGPLNKTTSAAEPTVSDVDAPGEAAAADATSSDGSPSTTKPDTKSGSSSTSSSGSGPGSRSGSSNESPAKRSGSSKPAESKPSDPKAGDSAAAASKSGDSDSSESKGSSSSGSSSGAHSKGSDSKGAHSMGASSKGAHSKGNDSKGAGSKGAHSKGNDSAPKSPAAAAAVTGDLTEAVKAAATPPPPAAADVIKLDDANDAAKLVAAAVAEADAPGRPLAKVDLPDVDSLPETTTRQNPAPTAQVGAVPAKAPNKSTADLLAGAPDLASVRNVFRRKRKVQARKVRRVVRHIDPWSVLTFSVLFHLSVFAALLLASVLVWNAAESAGTIENLETFILELGDFDEFEIKGEEVFRAAVAIAGVLTLASSVLLVLLTVVFNLISDLVGGIRLTVIEEETVRVRRRKKPS